MKTDWEKTILSKKVLINPNRNLPRGTNSIYVSMQDLETNRRDINTFERREFKGSGSKFKNGDTLIARITPCLENGKTAFVDFLKEEETAHGSTEFIVLSNIVNVSDNLFIYYLARNPEFRAYAISHMEGSSGRQRVPSVSISRYEICLPPLSEQRAIAHILGSLDDKIELNRQMNETLEEMARTIFKSWFVDFDPVFAKAEGRDPGLPPDIATLFQDSFENSELGKIPKGWRIFTIDKICEFSYGKPLKANDRILGNIPVFGSNGQIGFHNTSIVRGPGIIIGRKGNPGIVTWSESDFYPIDTAFYITLKQYVTSMPYFFYALERLNLPSLSADSAVPGLNRNVAYMSKILIPDERILFEFCNHIRTIYKTIDENKKESNLLIELRDYLLPKLISGEIRVPDVNKFIKENSTCPPLD